MIIKVNSVDEIPRIEISGQLFEVDTLRPVGRRNRRKKTPHAPVIHIREWAKRQGYDVGDHARLPRDVIRDYYDSHPEDMRRAVYDL